MKNFQSNFSNFLLEIERGPNKHRLFYKMMTKERSWTLAETAEPVHATQLGPTQPDPLPSQGPPSMRFFSTLGH